MGCGYSRCKRRSPAPSRIMMDPKLPPKGAQAQPKKTTSVEALKDRNVELSPSLSTALPPSVRPSTSKCPVKSEKSKHVSSDRANKPRTRSFETLRSQTGTSEADGTTVTGEKMFVIIEDFRTMQKGELNVEIGERVQLLNDGEVDWKFVKREDGSEKGWVPVTCIVPETELDRHPWFFGRITAREAWKLLSDPTLELGTFLIRQKFNEDSLVLSVRNCEPDIVKATKDQVKHYRIEASGTRVWILDEDEEEEDNPTFQSVERLVDYYLVNQGSLCTKLGEPCPKQRMTRIGLSYETDRKWELPREDFELIEELGKGNFAKVFKGKWKKDGSDVAIKVMHSFYGKEEKGLEKEFLKEAQVMRQLRHPNIVRFYGVCIKGSPIYIIMEYLERGSLLKFFEEAKKWRRELRTCHMVDICAQVAGGLAYLEAKSAVHRDIAARNILVNGDIASYPVVKIADFGLTRAMTGGRYKPDVATSAIRWTAPEALTRNLFSSASDVWSFGVLVYEVFTQGGRPYEDLDNAAITGHVLSGQKLKKPETMPKIIYEKCLTCWNLDPNQRPKSQELFRFFDLEYFVERDKRE